MYAGRVKDLRGLLLGQYRNFYRLYYSMAAENAVENNFHLDFPSVRELSYRCRFISKKMSIAKLLIKYKSAQAKSGNPD